MNDYVLLTDSTTDITPEMIENLGITVLPLSFTIQNKEYQNYPDGRDMSITEFYRLVRAGNPASTAQINTGTFLDTFESYLKDGKDVLYIAFSSALSGTYNSSALAAEELAQKYPERKIYAIDSLCASMGEGLLLYYAAKEKEMGRSIEEVRDWLLENRLHLCHWFTVDDLNHLKRGGRVSATAALVGTMLGIKPILHVDDQGRLIPVTKVRGRNQSLEALVDNMARTCLDTKEQTIFISHGDCLEDAKKVEKLVRDRFKVKDVAINFVGPVIGAHSGPGTVALFFLGKQRL